MPQNMLVILTDDQRFDTLWAMPVVQQLLLERGVQFTQATVSTPLCCPSRASFLSGGYYAHTTGVLTNALPWGSAERFIATDTLPVRLQQAGVATALIGKYLNGFLPTSLVIPPGWTHFQTKANGSWTDFRVEVGASTEAPGVGHLEDKSQYMTDYWADAAVAFLEGVGAHPFFLLWAPAAPHEPATPAAQDTGLFPSYVYRGRGYGEDDRSDKPAHVREKPALDAAADDAFHRNQLRSLQAVDRAVGRLIATLEATGQFENTLVVFTSDNGYMWGEHGLNKKGAPYEESVRVPLIVLAPGILPRSDRNLVVGNLDLPATALALAGLPPSGDGLSLLSLLADTTLRLRPQGTFHEAYAQGGIATTWAGWRTREYKYVEHDTGETELYDLTLDPYELANVAFLPAYQDIQERMAGRVARLERLDLGVSLVARQQRHAMGLHEGDDEDDD